MTVLVAGGTGRLGTALVERLTARDIEVRVLTRDRGRASHLPSAVEVVEGDVRERQSVEQAVVGADIVVSAVHGFMGPGRVTPRSVDRAGNENLVAAAERERADVVLVSVVGAAADHPMELFRCKFAAEQLLERSGVRWTIVRATAFAELWAEMCEKGIVFGRGDNPNNFVAVADVADAVELAVVDDGRRGQILEIGGPDNLTFNELAALVRELRGAPDRIRHVPRWVLRAVAPLHRVPRAALTMDTIDMTFHPVEHAGLRAPRSVREALVPLLEGTGIDRRR